MGASASFDNHLRQTGGLVAKKWFMVHTYSGFEDRVSKALKERIDARNMQDLFGEIKVPKETIVEIKDGKKREVERKLFPGYILVEMETVPGPDGQPKIPEEAWYLVRQTPKVTGFVGSSKRPQPLTDEELQKILHHVEATKEKPKPKEEIHVGDLVRITEGPFTNFTGKVEEVNEDRSTVKVSVTIFGRSTPVEVSFLQIQKL